MAGPYDYSLGGTVDPSTALGNGLQLGAAMRALPIQQAQQDLALQQQRQQMALQQQQQAVIQRLITNPNAGAQDYANASLVVPALKENLKQAWDMKSSDQQQGQLQYTGQVFAALQNGQPGVASKLLRDRAEVMAASNPQDPEVKAMKTMADIADAHPDFARSLIGMKLSALPGGEKVVANLAGLGGEARAAEQAPAKLAEALANARKTAAEATTAESKSAYSLQAARADAKKADAETANINSQIAERAARLGLDRDKLTSETQVKLTELQQKFGQIPDDARKVVNEAATQSALSANTAAQMFDLAGRLESEGGGFGSFSTAAEWYAKATGKQDGMTGLRQEYTRLRATGVMKSLPPGPASDKDIQIASEGFPPANADAKYLASFLRGMAKTQAFDAALNNVKAEWVAEVGQLSRTKKDIEVSGVKVPAGTTFDAFSKQFLSQKADEFARDAQIQQRGYMRFAK